MGHALNVIVIQAGGAQRVFESKPQIARDALGSIETVGRAALGDMERMLGVLLATDQERQPGPQPGLKQLGGLAAQVSEAGLPVEVVVEGKPLDMPASADLSAYRIVQEALTNALKHSRASHARVVVKYHDDGIELEVSDDGIGLSDPTRNANKGGRGLLGMRERVALFGGELSVGPALAGGYLVQARLPIKSAGG